MDYYFESFVEYIELMYSQYDGAAVTVTGEEFLVEDDYMVSMLRRIEEEEGIVSKPLPPDLRTNIIAVLNECFIQQPGFMNSWSEEEIWDAIRCYAVTEEVFID